jgi:hypothetical protein
VAIFHFRFVKGSGGVNIRGSRGHQGVLEDTPLTVKNDELEIMTAAPTDV